MGGKWLNIFHFGLYFQKYILDTFTSLKHKINICRKDILRKICNTSTELLLKVSNIQNYFLDGLNKHIRDVFIVIFRIVFIYVGSKEL